MSDYSVLIIDDDIWMQRILSRTLQSYGFKTTYLASNGFEGISLAVEHQPMLVIMDILMPELSGHLTLKVLKSIRSTKNIPVLMVSALSDTENLGLAVKSGMSGFISKPFTRATVYEKLIAIFGKDTIDMLSRNDFADIFPAGKNPKAKEKPEVPSEPDKNQPLISEKEETAAPASRSVVSPDQLMQYYQEDEKRSIESIKKLLQKSKQ